LLLLLVYISLVACIQTFWSCCLGCVSRFLVFSMFRDHYRSFCLLSSFVVSCFPMFVSFSLCLSFSVLSACCGFGLDYVCLGCFIFRPSGQNFSYKKIIKSRGTP
jgi:hypothetical protein